MFTTIVTTLNFVLQLAKNSLIMLGKNSQSLSVMRRRPIAQMTSAKVGRHAENGLIGQYAFGDDQALLLAGSSTSLASAPISRSYRTK